jgi:signal peptidase I
VRSNRSFLRRFLLLFGAVVLVATWFTWLRPTALGGSASYVIVVGSSMEPTYSDGDLVLIRAVERYDHGDVIAFRAGGILDDPTRIIHRIVGDAADGAFVTQGDNRDRTDPWQPGPDDIIGRAELHVPMAGDLARFVARPEAVAALGGAAVLVGGQRRRRRRLSTPDRPPAMEPAVPEPRHQSQGPATDEEARPAAARSGRMTQPRWAFIGLVVTGLLAGPVLAMTWSALRAPDATQRIEQVGQVEARIGVDYRFSGPPSVVYPTGTVGATRNPAGALAPADPLYSELLRTLEVDLAFRADAQGADQLSATHSVEVALETPGGWSTTLQRLEPERFEGTAVETIRVDLAAVKMRVAEVATLTGVGGDAHTITVTPRLEVTGRADATVLDERVSAPLTFAVERNQITPNAGDASQTRELTRTVSEPARYAVGPMRLGTQSARGLLGGLALVLVAGIAWFASVLFGGLGLGEPDRIAARYRSQIVDVAAAAAPPGPVVMVSAIDELARIAKLEQAVILHEDLGDGAHRYRVFLGNVTYEYEAAPEHAGFAANHLPRDTADDEPGG